MIRKTYSTSVNCTNPQTYFEKFWAHCWYNVAGLDRTDSKFVAMITVREELEKEDIQMIHYYNINKVDVLYPTDEDYTWFKLKWS